MLPSTSRRQALRSTVVLAAALAGCGARRESPPTPTPSAEEPPEDARSDPPHVQVRGAAPGAGIRTGTPAATTEERDRWNHRLVTSEAGAAALRFVGVDKPARARTFLRETSFDTETVYVEEHRIGACYRRRLCWVRWSDDEIETSYATGYRDADVACEADETDVVVTLIRLPVALSARTVTEFESRSGSGGCRPVESGSPGPDGDAAGGNE